MDNINNGLITYFENNSSHSKVFDSIRKLNHDVRSPINGIVGIASLLIEDKKWVKVRTQDITMIKEAAETIIEIIDDVLDENDFTKNMPYSLQQRSLCETFEKIRSLYKPLIQKKELSFTIHNHFDSMIKIPDHLSIKLQQIVGNLVSNAIKFTPKYGALQVTSQLKDRKQSLLNITVEDNGKSMSEDQTSAFNNGQPVERSAGTNGEQSFGIGLQHVKQLVLEEGGTITVSSLKGRGTQFSVSLPIIEKSNAPN